MRMNLLALAAVPALLSAASYGAVITYGPTTFDNGGAGYNSGSGGNFNVQQFNPSLGTLTKVTLTVVGNSHGGTNAFENSSAFPGTDIHVSIGTDITITGPGSLVVLTTPAQSASGSVTAFDGLLDFLGTSTLKITGTDSTDTDSAEVTTPANLVAYVGLGNVNFSFISSVNVAASGDVSPSSTQSTPTKYDFVTTVTYEYTPVPEAASLGVLTLGALSLLARRRK